MRIDVHCHFIPDFVVAEAQQDPDRYGLQVDHGSGGVFFRHRQGYRYPVPDTFTDPHAMVRAMDQAGLDGRVVSLAPTLFLADQPKDVQTTFLRRANQWAAEACRAAPGRLWAMGAVPLPHVAEAVEELDHIRSLGLVGVEIACFPGGRPVDDPEFRPFFARAAELGLPVFLHPVYLGPQPGLEEFYFINTIGNPYQTLVAAARILHSGLAAELPQLQVLLAHGGGFFPYQRGRFQHAWHVRSEPKVKIDRPPLEYAGCLYFDSLTHDPLALRFLVDAFGEDRVLMGSDFPFDMGTETVVADVAEAGLPGPVLAKVQGDNAVHLFHLG
ncbi:amidohydrolase family protein [Thermaerobacter composti]|uniref:Amidohydrolase family protein n=1 Tax=Thermaerobacter composti TaxID=554949 RepID=A0ABZ0QP44_9FIRM|nr:amidohydrolase family protein [Thermaerobacter composti]WPD18542.1 amidohydrolase family protein [Thermaerobacter composti]